MSIGKLGRKHTIILKPRTKGFCLLTDISGVTYANYDYFEESNTNGLTPIEIKSIINSSLQDVVIKIVSHIEENTKILNTI
jgi:predicted nucleotide-binding protein